MRPNGEPDLHYLSSLTGPPEVLFPASYYSQTDWPADIASIALKWSEKPDGTYCIDKGFSETMIMQECTDIVLPQSIDKIPVTEIAPLAFTTVVLKAPATNPKEKRSPVSSSLTIPDTIEKIGDYSITGLNAIRINIPASVKEIGSLGLYGAEAGIQSNELQFHVDERSRHYRSVEGSLYSYDMTHLVCHAKPYEKVMVLPKTLTHIDYNSFTYGSSSPSIIYAPDALAQVSTVPNRNCLWVCSRNSPAYKAIRFLSLFAVSDSFGVEGDFAYDLTDENEVVLVRYRGKSKNIVVPSQLGGRTLKIIGPNAFPLNLESISLPDTVERLEGNYPLARLRQIRLPKNLHYIGPNSFATSQIPNWIVIPESCTFIGEGSFGYARFSFRDTGARVLFNSKAFEHCFAKGSPPFDFALYDEDLLHHQDYPGKIQAILTRITYPYQLDQKTLDGYLEILNKNRSEVIEYLLQTDDLLALATLLEKGFFSSDNITDCLDRFHKVDYTPGIIALLDYRHNHCNYDKTKSFAL